MVHPCDKPCSNKTASGYCATTACINPQFSNIGTAHYGQGVQKRIVTNYDRVHAMNAEELAEFLKGCGVSCPDGHFAGDYECHDCKDCWLDWLRQEAQDG